MGGLISDKDMAVTRKTFPVAGMGCSACVARVENTLKQQKGVESASVSLASNSAQVDYDPQVVTAAGLKKAVQDAGYDLIVPDEADEDPDSDPESEAEAEAERRREDDFTVLKRDMWLSVILAALIMLLGMGFEAFPGKGWVLAGMAAVSVFWCGRRFIVTAWRQACHGSANMDTLVALSTCISFFFSLFNLLFPQVWTSRGLEPRMYFESSSMIVAFILVGRVLEERAKHSTTASIRQLIGLQPKQVHVRVGEVVLVKPGDRIPVDGQVTEGTSFVDESMLTGEPLPNRKEPGEKVFAGTINQKGSLAVRAEKVGKDTMLSAIIRMVRDAQGSKAKIQQTVDKVAAVFVPVIIAISILAFLSWAFLADDGVARGLLAMVTVLVIACPCSLGLATPTALIAGIGKGASQGILIRDADSLQIAEKVDTVVLDKTGTITVGHPEVTDLEWIDASARQGGEGILKAMESRSEHPLAGAILRALEDVAAVDGVEAFESVPGEGIRASHKGRDYFVGNRAPQKCSISDTWRAEGKTVMYFHDYERVLAVIAVADAVKDSSVLGIRRLRDKGVAVHLLTGDNEGAAGAVAAQVGIDEVHAGMLPQDKALYIKNLQQLDHTVAMVGDGINDSAALAQADLSVAMGQGSDIAISTAMVTVVSSDLEKLPQLFSLSRKTSRIIKENLVWASLYNLVAVPVAAGLFYPVSGFVLNPMIAAAAMACSSVLVVTNSLRLRR